MTHQDQLTVTLNVLNFLGMGKKRLKHCLGEMSDKFRHCKM